ncbi:glycosyltransferase family 2 protein [Pseudoteredinibacter isoporae]|uniref:Rhamnosyltransferase n=1 Tax=Pseudoteredinibacter isoporae TaxID=570281 RepID=A0A7X0JR31_9GAMM|nr:glycosyltransferase family 2 protein [Pseudoteredinibacter isoporae]MBB6520103.1 rhamnosyltransferase [Pseudoteredinibacter isoporae]NHO85675.1 glycosyltransferase family 2 protein [Pseudoteredinibacter isoporae]NIB25873.1 glycosyltransferase family 2 protein [Pseudoteredinibacter isoporae]
MSVSPELAAEEKLLSVIVSYNPDLVELEKLIALLAEQSDVCLVDNGSSNSDQLKEQFDSRLAFFMPQEANIGLAAALNLGIQCARENTYKAVLLFDQDSVPVGDFVGNMDACYEAVKANTQLDCALIGPRLIHPDTQKATRFKQFKWPFNKNDEELADVPGVYYSDFVITSGSYIPLSSIHKVGLMKEEYFIDNIDLEWCFRALSRNMSVLGCDGAQLRHSIGEEQTNPLFRALGLKQHKPKRSYYTTRNRLDLYRQNYAPSAWKVRDFLRFIIKTALQLLLSKDRRALWHYISLAIRGKPVADL